MNQPQDARIDQASTLPEGYLLSQELLSPANVTEHGERIFEDTAQLVRIPDLERTRWAIPINLIDRNPLQPRMHFDKDRLQQLGDSIDEKEQEDDIQVVPFVRDGETNVRLMLIDGERRWRSMKAKGKDTIRGVVKWKSTMRDVFESGAIINLNKAGHTPLEEARIFERMLAYAEKTDKLPRAEALRVVGMKTGSSPQKVENFLKLLQLPKEVQSLVASGQLDSFAALQLSSAQKKWGGKLDALKAARLIVDNPQNRFQVADRGTRAGAITRAGVRQAVNAALIESATQAKGRVDPREILEREVADRMLGFNTSIASITRATRRLVGDPKMVPIAVDLYRNRSGRGQPPEKIIDDLETALSLLKEAYQTVLKPATLPPAIKIPGRNPPFTEQVEKVQFSSPDKAKIAKHLAGISENKDARGTIFTAEEIAATLKMNVTAVASHLGALNAELEAERLAIRQYPKRKRAATTGKLDKVPAYRMEWIIAQEKDRTEEFAEVAATLTSKVTKPPT